MNAPLIWLGLPAIFGIGLWFIRKREVLTLFLAAGLCLVMFVLALLLPIDSVFRLGPWAFQVDSTLSILGRRLVLGNSDRAMLAMMYGFSGFWFVGGWVARPGNRFATTALAITVLLIASLAVEPFLYAALLVEMAVLFSIPMLVPHGSKPGQGVLRFLIFQTIGMPFMLLAGWASTGYEANPSNELFLLQAVVLLGLGLALWLAVFPFYTWVPLVAEEAHPYAAGFLFILLPVGILLLVLEFLNNFAWLREFPLTRQALEMTGLVMVIGGGVWAAFQKDLSRLLAYAVIIETGYALVALSLNNVASYQAFFGGLLPRFAGLSLWSLALVIFKRGPGTRHDQLVGVLRQLPVVGSAFLVAGFSVAGIPLLAGFPIRQIIFENYALSGGSSTLWLFGGTLGLVIGCLRTLAVMATPTAGDWRSEETWAERIFLGVGILFILLMGMFPDRFVSVMQRLLSLYGNLK
jgi:NADH-quinone oxidoreductase subunit N